MKITRCKYGHYYDKAYFRECPHCCRARGGRDEDIIIGKNELSTDLSGKNSLPGRNVRINQLQDDSNYGQGSNRDISQKEQDRKKAERWIGEAWDELEKVAKESPKTKVTEKAAQREKQEDRQEKITEEDVYKRQLIDSVRGYCYTEPNDEDIYANRAESLVYKPVFSEDDIKSNTEKSIIVKEDAFDDYLALVEDVYKRQAHMYSAFYSSLTNI